MRTALVLLNLALSLGIGLALAAGRPAARPKGSLAGLVVVKPAPGKAR